MSTKTYFKRTAFVAVAALGMSLLSTVPASANVVVSSITSSSVAGTSARTVGAAGFDSATAATLTVSFQGTAATDTMAITIVPKSRPSDATAYPTLLLQLADTVTAGSSGASTVAVVTQGTYTALPSNTESNTTVAMKSAANTTAAATFRAFVDTATAAAGRAAGTYVWTAILTPYNNNSELTTNVQTRDITLTVTALASESTTISPGSSTAFMGTSANATSDANISALATASSTPAAYIAVVTKNAAGTAKPESITATISGAGILAFNSGAQQGSSITVAGDGGSNIEVRPDGRAGVATITISTPTRVFPAKTLTFYTAAPTKLVTSVPTPLLAVGTNTDAVRITATDANGTLWSGALYIYAKTAADAAIAGAERASTTGATTCAFDTGTDQRNECTVTGVSAGTATMVISNYATAAAATAALSGAEITAEVKVVVSVASIATVKLEFDKATYNPGERARIYVTPLDSAGKTMQATSFTNLFATGGISTASALTFAGSTTTAESLTAVNITTVANSSSTSGARAGSAHYTVYMPTAGGTVTISATGSSALPLAGRVAISASAAVTDSGAQALAAVSALATTVASLKTLITTLTNLVLKIQKKVKA
jgi:hypothetical protein